MLKPPHQYKILVVDDESDVVEFLSYNLKKEGFVVIEAYSGQQAVKKAAEEIPDLILLDVMMPEMDGIETCERLRENPALHNTLIAFLSARSEDYSQIAGFNSGADDYITKPVRVKVLISRINALLKRNHAIDTEHSEKKSLVQHIGDIIIDQEKYIVIKNNQTIILTKREFNLLLLLTSKPGKVFTRNEIYNKIWNRDVIVGDRTIDVYIKSLRNKIGQDKIKTFKGIGYKFEIAK